MTSKWNLINVINIKNYDMATVYKVELVSHWINYTKEDLQKLLEKAVKTIEVNGNEIQIEVTERK